jgi:hypothetical protein
MEALDGNAIGGLLQQVFGAEMTTAVGTCAHCGTRGVFAELEVYMRAPGTVARCRTCHEVVFVIVEAREVDCVDLQGLTAVDSPSM